MAVYQFQRVAHRGGSHLAPENTLAAFRNALTMSVDAIELDVQMSRDGQAIVFHDYAVDRLTDGTGNILDLDFVYLRTLNAATHFAGGWPQKEQIPRLREVLDLVRRRVQVYIEIKPSRRDGMYGRYPNIVQSVISEIRVTRMLDQVLVISFDWSVLSLIKSLEPSLQIGALVSKEMWKTAGPSTIGGQAKSLQASWLNLDAALFSSELPPLFHKQGLKLGLWTVNALSDLRSFAAAGVDSLTTDRPDLFAQL